MRVDLQVQGTSFIEEATVVFAIHSHFWCFNKVPFSALVMSDKCLYIFLDFTCRNTFFNFENFLLYFLLLSIGRAIIAHARFACLLCFHGNHVIFTPFLLKVLAIFCISFSFFSVHIFVYNESSIKRSDTLKINSITLNHVFHTQRKRACIFIRDVEVSERC